MDFEFDKEIDAILRKARGDEAAAASSGAHLDADEIAAFAENALPAAARERSTAHFADCARCRKILSNVFVYQSEAEKETASAGAAANSAAAPAPWYRRLFAFPQAAYAMGAMVLLFGGFFGYLALQNLPGSMDSEVSYSANTATTAPASERSAVRSNSNAASSANAATTSNATTTNSTVQSNPAAAPEENTFSAGNSARLSTSNTTTAATPLPQDAIAQAEAANPTIAEVQPMATPAPKPAAKDESDDKNSAKPVPVTPSAAGATRQEDERNKEDSELADRSSTTNAPEEKQKARRSMPNALKKQENSAGEQRSVGGKTFNNVGGIWFDAAVGKQKQKTVRRGTGDYQKLDAGLRSIADQLGGTVVVLWGGRAYRIQ